MENLHKPSRRIHSPRRSRTSGASPSLKIPNLHLKERYAFLATARIHAQGQEGRERPGRAGGRSAADKCSGRFRGGRRRHRESGPPSRRPYDHDPPLSSCWTLQEEEPVSSMTRAIQIMVPVTSPAAQAAQENATPVASAVTLNTPAASCPPPAYPVPSPPCDAPAPLTPPQIEQTSPDPDSTPQASVTTPEGPRAIAG